MTFLQITNHVQTEYSSSDDVSDRTSINIPSDINLTLHATSSTFLKLKKLNSQLNCIQSYIDYEYGLIMCLIVWIHVD